MEVAQWSGEAWLEAPLRRVVLCHALHSAAPLDSHVERLPCRVVHMLGRGIGIEHLDTFLRHVLIIPGQLCDNGLHSGQVNH